jgi:hypothetical protein
VRHMVFAGIIAATSGFGCDRADRPVPPIFTAPSVVGPAAAWVPPADGVVANWTARARVVSATGGEGCGWGRAPGETRDGVLWRIVIDDESILLDEDMRNWPTDDVAFRGTLEGRRFTARVEGSPDYLNYACQWRGGVLTGEFNADFTSFEADESLFWGPPQRETVVRRHWVGAPLPE